MSTTYIPRNKRSAIRTEHSYADGAFDANVDGGQATGALHRAFGLPLDPWTHESNVRWGQDSPERTPFKAAAKETQRWARVITQGLRFVEDDDPYKPFFEAWRDFLASCGGYYVTP